jgi:hypothetical protein
LEFPATSFMKAFVRRPPVPIGTLAPDLTARGS